MYSTISFTHIHLLIMILLFLCPGSKADPNSLDNAENSPLHLAVRGRHKDVVRLLLSAQADAHQFNCNGKSPLNLAKDKEMKNILLGKEPSSAGRILNSLSTLSSDQSGRRQSNITGARYV